jgi:hypothetical protein
MLAYGAGSSFAVQASTLSTKSHHAHVLDIRPLSAEDIHHILDRKWGKRDCHGQLSKDMRVLTGGHARSCATCITDERLGAAHSAADTMKVASDIMKGLVQQQGGENGIGDAFPIWRDDMSDIQLKASKDKSC